MKREEGELVAGMLHFFEGMLAEFYHPISGKKVRRSLKQGVNVAPDASKAVSNLARVREGRARRVTALKKNNQGQTRPKRRQRRKRLTVQDIQNAMMPRCLDTKPRCLSGFNPVPSSGIWCLPEAANGNESTEMPKEIPNV